MKKTYLNKKLAALLLSALLVTGCGKDGTDGQDGVNGQDGVDGQDASNGLTPLIKQTDLFAGNSQCFKGGLRIDSGADVNNDSELADSEIQSTSYICSTTLLNEDYNFNRIATFPVCSQIDPNCNTDTETAAEIVAASTDGNTLIYSDSPAEIVGFVNIIDPENPIALGTFALTGEPTSVAVKDDYVLVGVNTSTDFVMVSGLLNIIDIATRTSVRTIDLGGQPDSVAVSPDGDYAAVIIENERDEDLIVGGIEGNPPQAPAGFLVIVNMSDADPANWTTANVTLTGLADLFPTDPEPEYVDINNNNVAVVTLQENNHIVLVNLVDGSIVNDFSAGTVDLTQVDLTEGQLSIDQTESQAGVEREPDGVSWINNEYFATADEGDLNGGSRGFTIFNTQGEIVWTAGNTLEHLTASLGHYPDKRSGNKGNEPENVEMGIYGDDRYLFVNSERSSLVFVYDVADPRNPVFKQTLPAGVAPEGGLAIPSRNLLVVASEADDRGDKIRSAINIYSYNYQESSYPTLKSIDRENGTPISWAALSGLSADPQQENILYSIEDSFFKSNRIFKIDTTSSTARIVEEINIKDSDDLLAAYPAATLADDTVDEDDVTRINVFDVADLAAMINADKTVNIDPEGIAKASDGGFWVVSEGNGTVGDADRAINSLNFIFKLDVEGVIKQVIALPALLNDVQLRFGFEGVAEYNDKVYVAFQRAWNSEASPRIGIYDLTNETWEFVFYPLSTVESQNGGWVGLSDLTSLGGGEFLVIERDNQGGPDAVIKRLYTIDLSAVVDGSTITKTLVHDLVADLKKPGGLVYEKIEGSAVMANGNVYIVNDNDGVDDNSGETQLINLGKILD